MEAKNIFEKLKADFGDTIFELTEDGISDAFIVVDKKDILEICLELRDNSEFKFDYMVNLSGMDLGKGAFSVVYHLYSIELKHRIVLKVMLTLEDLNVDSVERCWKTANWHEREAYDMFGINFIGHPNMIRILCPYDWVDYPLRKDYKQPEVYKGMKVPF